MSEIIRIFVYTKERKTMYIIDGEIICESCRKNKCVIDYDFSSFSHWKDDNNQIDFDSKPIGGFSDW